METVYTYLQCTDGLCAVANGRFLSAFCGADIFLPATCYCKDGDYLEDERTTSSTIKKIGVYKVEDLTERLQSTYSYASLDSIKVYESLNAIAFYCSPHIEKRPLWQQSHWSYPCTRTAH